MLPKVRRVPVGLFPKNPSHIRKGRLLTVKTAPNRAGLRRYGVIVPKAAVNRATERNRLKRFAYRILSRSSVKGVEDVIVILKSSARTAKPEELEKELVNLAG
ncbi:MAG: ribonuclease P protein component [bacterium]|nr:ribonuclease P protein component [bacterium]